MKKQALSIAFIIIFLIVANSALAGDFYVQSPVNATSIRNACQKAFNYVATGPHNVIIPNGTYGNLGNITIDSTWDAQSGKEITIKAETPGGVTFTGTSRFIISGDYWIISGFVWNSFSNGDDSHAIRVTGRNIRVTDNEFKSSGGINNRVYATRAEYSADNLEFDHNYIHDWAGIGILTGSTSGDVALNPNIHHNYFKNFPLESDDDSSTVFLDGEWHISDHQEQGAIVEYNIFENNAGDGENICVKNSSNIIRYNVFLNLGTSSVSVEGVSLRLGEDNTVFNNWFIRTDNSLMQGITVSDRGHKIVNNYFKGLGGTARAIYFLNGNEYNRDKAENVLFESNTFVNCVNSRLLQFGSTTTLPPTSITIRNNIFHSGGSYIGKDYTSGNCSATYTDNIAYTTGTYFSGTGCGGNWPADSSNLNRLTSEEFSGLWTIQKNDEYGDIYVLNSAFESQLSTLTDSGFSQNSVTEPVTKEDVGPTWMNPPTDNILSPPSGLQIIKN